MTEDLAGKVVDLISRYATSDLELTEWIAQKAVEDLEDETQRRLAFGHLASAYLVAQQGERAREVYEEALKRCPSFAIDLKIRIARTYFPENGEAGDLRQVIHRVNRLLENVTLTRSQVKDLTHLLTNAASAFTPAITDPGFLDLCHQVEMQAEAQGIHWNISEAYERLVKTE